MQEALASIPGTVKAWQVAHTTWEAALRNLVVQGHHQLQRPCHKIEGRPGRPEEAPTSKALSTYLCILFLKLNQFSFLLYPHLCRVLLILKSLKLVVNITTILMSISSTHLDYVPGPKCRSYLFFSSISLSTAIFLSQCEEEVAE